MIQPIIEKDAPAVLAVAESSGLFAPDELGEVRGMLEAHLSGELGSDHHWLGYFDGGLTGVAYFAPEPFSDGVWNLYMLAIDPEHQGSGHGAALVRHFEAAAAAEGARILLIETSSLPRYERTRSFYGSCGYELEARVRDYYAPGDDKIVYWKSVAA